jgi:hypothetical protein
MGLFWRNKSQLILGVVDPDSGNNIARNRRVFSAKTASRLVLTRVLLQTKPLSGAAHAKVVVAEQYHHVGRAGLRVTKKANFLHLSNL